jgi:hypothetical protein
MAPKDGEVVDDGRGPVREDDGPIRRRRERADRDQVQVLCSKVDELRRRDGDARAHPPEQSPSGVPRGSALLTIVASDDQLDVHPCTAAA